MGTGCPPARAAIGLALLLAAGIGPLERARANPRVSIMTQNMDEGTDYQALVTAPTPAAFVAAVTQTYNGIEGTEPASRAAAMALTIATRQPDLVSLQEASIVRTGATPPATGVSSDLLASLLASLAALGQHYAPVAVGTELDAEAPSGLGVDVRLTTRDVILARTDLPASRLSVANPRTGHFATQLVAPTAVGPIALTRGWASVDVTVDGQAFRLVDTHLDTGQFSPALQRAQAMELLGDAGATTLPVVYAGDFNSAANNPSDPTFPTYGALIGSGLADAWTTAHSGDPGPTCCESPDLANSTPTLSERIDLALVTAGIGVDDAELVGISPSDRTADGLWPSDHAGLLVALDLPVPEPSPLGIFGLAFGGAAALRCVSRKTARRRQGCRRPLLPDVARS